MSKESKFVEVKTSETDATIELWQTFGWELLSAQEIFDRNSHLEKRGDSTYSVTSTVNYVKMTFQRDRNMSNYAELVSLEQKFYAIDRPKREHRGLIEPDKPGIKWLALNAIGVVAFIGGILESDAPTSVWVVGLICSIIGGGVYFLEYKEYKKEYKQYIVDVKMNKNDAGEYENKLIEFENKKRELLKRAKALLT
jgi:hypothetical protein